MLDHGRCKRKTKPYPALWSATAHYSRPRRAGSRPGLGTSGPWFLYCASRCLPTWFGLTTLLLVSTSDKVYLGIL